MSLSIQTRSDVDASLIREVISEKATSQYFNIALLALLIYHSTINVDKEVKYFWSNPLNTVSVIYFANRYIGLLGAICPIILDGLKVSLMACQFSNWTQAVANTITIVLIDYILLIRVLALYHQNKRLAICLKVLLALEAAVDLGIVIFGTLSEEVAAIRLSETLSLCGVHRNPPMAVGIISWSIPMAYGFVLLVLALYKAAEYWKLSRRFQGYSLVTVLVHDQIIYYGSVIFCCVLNIMNIRLFGAHIFITGILGKPTLLCIVGAHLLINLKEAGEKGVNGGTNLRTESVSDMRFA